MTVDAYLSAVEPTKRAAFQALFEAVQANIPSGFTLRMAWGMPSWVVPLERYPPGYHVTPDTPLPFMSLAAQRRHIAVYHMGLYADPQLLQWFRDAYPAHCTTKLDMGKSCIRFCNPKKIPTALIAELVSRMDVEAWIALYERSRG